MAGRDVIGLSQTGSGKTAAFVVPFLARLGSLFSTAPRSPIALFLAPTRELVAQTRAVFASLSAGTTMVNGHAPHVVTVVGGTSIAEQCASLARRVDVVFATPGRLLHLLQAGAVSLLQYVTGFVLVWWQH